MAVLHHHRLVPRQSEGDAVLPAAVDGLQQQQQAEAILTHSGTFSNYSRVLLDYCNGFKVNVDKHIAHFYLFYI